MKTWFRSVRFKITCWYTFVIIIVFAGVLAAAFFYSEYYGEVVIQDELFDEVSDIKEDIATYQADFPLEDMNVYYDDGVMLSLFDENQQFITGLLPDDYPDNIEFVEQVIRKIEFDGNHWFFLDVKAKMNEDTEIWIRGIHSYSSIIVLIQNLIRLMCAVFPLLILFTAFIGNQMIKNSLRQMKLISHTAAEISDSLELSRRIPLSDSKDEFTDLAVVFNDMLERLEGDFLKEKQLSSDAAHELRTPVAVILSHSEYCLDELELSEKAREELRIIRDKSREMSQLVSSLLMISREERRMANAEFEEVDLEMLAESVAEELEEQAAEKNIHIEVENFLKNSVIFADMSMISRLFINLIDNAIAYGKESGYVKVILEEQGEKVCLKFRDNGIGIPKEAYAKIWNRFYQVDASRSNGEGYGLGLYLVKQIVDCHKGTIEVESQIGKGSTFTVRIPRIQKRNEN